MRVLPCPVPPLQVEHEGLDVSHHGGHAYPADTPSRHSKGPGSTISGDMHSIQMARPDAGPKAGAGGAGGGAEHVDVRIRSAVDELRQEVMGLLGAGEGLRGRHGAGLAHGREGSEVDSELSEDRPRDQLHF